MSHTLGIKLEGEIRLGTFANVMQKFDALLRSLTTELAGRDTIEWEIEDLRPGSATATVRAIPREGVDPDWVVDGFRQVGLALSEDKTAPYTVHVGYHANELLRIANDGSVTLVHFLVSNEDVATAEPKKVRKMLEPQSTTLGMVDGRMEGLANRPKRRITVYDELFDRAVNCWPNKEWYDKARGLMGQRIRISGELTEDQERGWVTDVRQIWKIELLGEHEEHTRPGPGILPWKPGDEPAEVAIRRLRDAS